MKLLELLSHDILPKQFIKFLDKYKNSSGLYINFSNHIDNTLDKSAYATPDDPNNLIHYDPIGTYTYPIEEVLAGLKAKTAMYGYNMKYLRVVQDVSKNKLVLSSIKRSDIAELLTKAFGDAQKAQRQLKMASIVQDGQVWSPGRLLFTAIQLRLKPVRKGDSINVQRINDMLDDIPFPPPSGTYAQFQHVGCYFAPTTPSAQTSMLINMGYDAIQDDADSQKRASINKNEPKQLLFLSRGAFKVIDVFTLRAQSDGSPRNISYPGYTPAVAKKFIKMLMHATKLRYNILQQEHNFSIQVELLDYPQVEMVLFIDTRKLPATAQHVFDSPAAFTISLTSKRDPNLTVNIKPPHNKFEDMVAQVGPKLMVAVRKIAKMDNGG